MAPPVRILLVFLLLPFHAPLLAEEGKWRSPESVEGAITTSLEQAQALHDDGAVFIDVRNPRLFARQHIPGAHHLDLKNGFEQVAVEALAAKSEPIVIYCSGVKCSRSYKAAAKAVSWGFQRVHYFRGGIVAWMDADLPIVGTREKSKR